MTVSSATGSAVEPALKSDHSIARRTYCPANRRVAA
jgi:hypothetical protein